MMKSIDDIIIFGTDMGALVSLVIVSRELFACKVPKPEWPVFNALNNVMASDPRTSPTMILSGLCLREFLTRS